MAFLKLRVCSKTKDNDETYRNLKLEAVIAQCPSKQFMCLNDMKLTDRDIPSIIQGVMEKNCARLFLEGNEITTKGVQVLIKGLSKEKVNNSTLKDLSLSRNTIGDDGAEHLVSLFTRGLTRLWLCQTNLTDRGVNILLSALQGGNETLNELHLEGNELITDASVDTIIRMVKQNQTLRELRLEKCSLSKEGYHRLHQGVQGKLIYFGLIFPHESDLGRILC
jgi:Ran GTPase-activating protein (RanGAP) involved in mRNA processing and transport